ncbi:metallophosphoesterase [Serratia sp. M24T3]|uniref:metallophosphoesterase n=1 Tax=Serratia sp. M24T3 TaxID=932213 RepID=UPI00025BB1EB|nr:metallophosphoesterase [Serratia sp. M24T3]EIC83600.1 metallophosphoesterase [Serratia sp. M24T3]
MALTQHIDSSKYRKVFVVGDLHGCLTQLNLALESQAFSAREDLLISVGDLIDRGEDSIGCLELIEKPWFACVRGNHEQMAIDALQGRNVDRWLRNGGDWFFKLPPALEARARELIIQAANLPHMIEITTDDGQFTVVAHADYPLNTYISGQPVDDYAVIWNRERITESAAGNLSTIAGAQRFYFGHTPVEEIKKYANQYYIDTGAVFGGHLTLLQIQ